MLRVPTQIKRYANEDILEAIPQASETLGIPMELVEITYDISQDESSDDFTVWATATIRCPDQAKDFHITWEYVVVDDEIYMGGSIGDLTDGLSIQYNDQVNNVQSSVRAATSPRKRRIVAAEGDDEFGSDMGGEDEYTNEDMDETFDELADSVDDMQEQITDVEEDDITIDVDNNIADHYIAECDACHGVFVSAVQESDQEIEHVTGICPLCDKESDQYLKWVVKEV